MTTKQDLQKARLAVEEASVELEDCIRDYLSNFGKAGHCFEKSALPAVPMDGEGRTLRLGTVRYYDGCFQGKECAGKWVTLSVYNTPGDYRVVVGYLSALLETT